ncbi:condensation domain-containing protein [Streptomyces tendae]|uniref:condensation domain-containing protein n=1 Tax=Streptomyces tendae TaxID=1932 RepID=UPI0036765B39
MTALAGHAVTLTAYQQDIWVAEHLSPSAHQLINGTHEYLTGSIDVEKLAASLRRVLERNDALRLYMDESDGQPFQWVEAVSADVAIVDLRSEPDPHAACLAWMGRAHAARLELKRSRLYEAALLRESDSGVHLCIRAHHILTDGWGLRQVVIQTLTDYEGSPDDTHTEPPSYLDFVADDRQYRGSAQHELEKSAILDGLSGFRPALFARENKGAGCRRGRVSFVIDADLVTKMRAYDNSPFPYIAAAVASWLTGVHQAAEVALGVPFLNRRTLEERRTVGMFTSLLPVRVRADGSRPMRDLAGEVRKSLRTTQENSRVSLSDVVLDSSDATGRRRPFDVTLSYARFPEPQAGSCFSWEGSFESTLHDGDALQIIVQVLKESPALRVDLDYDSDVFDESLPVETIGKHVLALIRQSLDTPASPVTELACWEELAAKKPVTLRLLASDDSEIVMNADHVVPRTDLERELAAVWAEALDVPSVGVHDNYFMLGGDSLTMLRLRFLCRQRGIRFALTDLMRGPTVAQLAARVVATELDDDENASAVSPFERGRQ